MTWGLSAQALRSGQVARAGRRLPDGIAEVTAAPLIEMLQREREHLAKLLGVLLGHGVQTRTLELETEQLDRIQPAMDAVIRAMGHNPADRDVRATVRATLARLA